MSEGVLLEQIIDQNKRVLEAVQSMQQNVAKIPSIEEKLENISQDLEVVKIAVTQTNQDLKLLQQRTTQLEAA